MTFLPIVDRELRVRARWPSTYHGRWVAVAVALLLGMPWLLSAPGNGQKMFAWLSTLAFAYCLFEGVRQTSDCLSSERRAGTLGLLFLTDLKGYDVVLGKIAGTSLGSVYGLVAMLPVLGLSLLTGGVTGGEFWRMVLVLLVTLFLSLSVGIWVSARSREELKALGAAAAILAAIAGGLPLIDMVLTGGNIGKEARLSLGSPAYACYLAFDTAYKTGGHAFWYSLLVIVAISISFLGLASGNAGKTLEEKKESEGLWQRICRPFISHQSAADRAGLIEKSLRKRARRKRLLEASPVLWLVSRKRGLVYTMWLAVALSSVFQLWQTSLFTTNTRTMILLPWAFTVLLHFVFWFCAALLASDFFVETRQNGAAELLLCTPLRNKDIMDGQWLHLKRAMIAPLLFMWLLQTLQMALTNFAMKSRVIAGETLFFGALTLWLQWLAVCWVGMWLGLSSKKPGQAAIITFLLVTLLPWLFCSGFFFIGMMPGRFSPRIPWVSMSGGMIFVSWMLMRWAQKNMRTGARAMLLREITGRPLEIKFKRIFREALK